MTGEFWKLYTARWLCGVLLLVGRFNISLAFPLCTTLEAPVPASGNLSFCSSPAYKQSGCCTQKDDRAIEHTFKSMNISNKHCAGLMRQILCAQCDAYSATLFGQITQDQRAVPYLCTSNSSTTSNNATGQGFCSKFWNTCLNVTIQNSPFTPGLVPGASPPPSSSLVANMVFADGSLGSAYASEADFCAGFGPSNATADYCFSGVPFEAPTIPSNYSLPKEVCVEKVGEDIYLNMVPHPSGSNVVAVTNQAGYVWLATAPGPGSSLVYDVSKPFLDISNRVTNENELGFLGFAFHPDFKDNGRFFVSYNCDKQMWADCGGTCACNADTNCNPSNLRNGQAGGDDGTDPCRYSSIIAEYTVNSTSASVSPLLAEVANPNEVRRIFTMSLPYTTHHAGGLLFGPLDNYLYFMMGDGGNVGDPFNFAQNKNSLLGKILRLDVDNVPSPTDLSSQGLWGTYGIPPSNPFVGQNGSQPEIWALGLRNPWRCTFDMQYPTYFYCADVGQEKAEEVDLISKGGNYGWRVYEGDSLYVPLLSPGGNTSAKSIDPIFPVLEYLHKAHPEVISAAITGGYVSYSQEDPCLYGRYVYGDLYGALYSAAEVPKFSGNYQTQQFSYQCSTSSPMNCSYSATNSSAMDFEEILSFGVDNSYNLYILAGNGVYRVVNPSHCNSVCTEVLPPLPPGFPRPGGSNPVPVLSPAPSPAQNSGYTSRYSLVLNVLVAVFTYRLLAVCFSG